MSRPQNFKKEDFVNAALRIIDAEGLDALSFRRLGTDMGVSYTAVYTYFDSKDALVTAVMGQIIDEMLGEVDFSSSTSPHEKLMKIGLSLRRILSQRPLRVTAFLSTATGPDGEADNGLLAVAAIMEEAGIPRDQLIRTYRVYESYVMGATAFDFSAAPEHISSRRKRYRDSRHPAFIDVAKSEKSIYVHNEESFSYGLDRLLRGLGI